MVKVIVAALIGAITLVTTLSVGGRPVGRQSRVGPRQLGWLRLQCRILLGDGVGNFIGAGIQGHLERPCELRGR